MQKYAAARAVRPTAVSVVRSSKSEVRRAKWGTAAPAVIHTGRRDEGAGTTDTARGPVGASRPRLADEGRMSKAECRNGAQRPCRDAGPPRRRLLYHLITLSPYHRPGGACSSAATRQPHTWRRQPGAAGGWRSKFEERSQKSEMASCVPRLCQPWLRMRAMLRFADHGSQSRGTRGAVPTFARSHVPTLASRGRLAPMALCQPGAAGPHSFRAACPSPLAPRPSSLVPHPSCLRAFVPSSLAPCPSSLRPALRPDA